MNFRQKKMLPVDPFALNVVDKLKYYLNFVSTNILLISPFKVENAFVSLPLKHIFFASFTNDIREKSIDLLGLCSNTLEEFGLIEVIKSPRELFLRISIKSQMPEEETD
jgi:hypothetical protein